MDRPSIFLYDSNMAKRAANQSIQTYNLFGESRDLPDVVHCETIAARSVLHNWEFAAHRHARLHQVLLVARGGGKATLEGQTHTLGPMRVVNVPVGHIHGFSFRRGTQGWVVTFAAEMLDQVLTPAEGLRQVLAHAVVLRGTPQVRMAMEQIFTEFAGRRFARAHVLRGLSSALIGLVAREIAAQGATPEGARKTDRVDRFEALLEQHFLEHWTVSDYADALSITPTHLTRLTRFATGHGALHWIVDRIVREARRNLVYTNLPISTIAYALGFEDPAYFSRVFAAATGRSPRAYRDTIHKAA